MPTNDEYLSHQAKKHCNWTYTGEFDCDKNGQVKAAYYESDCGQSIKWTRDNKIGKLCQRYDAQVVPQGHEFYVRCPYCQRILNIYNPYDDGETWRIKD